MFRKEAEAINWIDSFGCRGGMRTLDHLLDVLAELGNPQDRLATIHVAGTNGKGSTVAFLRHVLVESGLRVGTFTSPYLTSFGERMSINAEPMTRSNLLRYTNQVKETLMDKNMSDFASFDVLTLMSFLYFVDSDVDIVIYETGIGGRLDSTNVIAPIVSAITNVGHDHADVLGDTQHERALEKLGIVKEKIPLFTTEEDPDLLILFKKICDKNQTNLYLPLKNAEFIRTICAGTLFHYKNYRFVKLHMLGKHQFKNAVLALAIIDYLITKNVFKIDIEDIYKGLDLTSWEGRFEHVQKSPPVILDGAHNLEGFKALVDALNDVYPNYRKKIIFSTTKVKDAKQLIEIISEVADEILFVRGTHPATVAPETLYDITNGSEKYTYVSQSFKKVINQTIKHLSNNEVLVICGSLYFVSDARVHLFKGRL